MFENLHPVIQALFATLFTWMVTALGAAVVFFFKKVNQKIMNLMLGFGAGVMIAASYWSLLSPAIELDVEMGGNGWLMPAIGFLLGGLFIVIASQIFDRVPALNQGNRSDSFKRTILLVLAVTLHNIPEGLAVGVGFATASMGLNGATLTSAMLLAVGIGLQNFPEGAGVSLPMRREGYGRGKSFFYGQASGFVEPIAGVIGCAAAMVMRGMLPFLLAFSAGAMIGVVTAELIPESVNSDKNIAVFGVTLGFLVMMILDVALG